MTPWGAMTIRASCEAWHARGLVGGWPQKGHEGQERIGEEQGGAQGSGLSFWLEANLKVEKHRGHSLHPSLPPLLSPGPLCRSPGSPTLPSLSWPSTPGTSASCWHAEPALHFSQEGRKVFPKGNSCHPGVPSIRPTKGMSVTSQRPAASTRALTGVRTHRVPKDVRLDERAQVRVGLTVLWQS